MITAACVVCMQKLFFSIYYTDEHQQSLVVLLFSAEFKEKLINLEISPVLPKKRYITACFTKLNLLLKKFVVAGHMASFRTNFVWSYFNNSS